MIFAGKAHPADHSGKALIQQIIQFAERHNLRKQIVFVEDYDMHIARYLVSGVDIWVNNPRRPMEASGTSGMKAAANGCLNVSTLDGWWNEAYTLERGWAIGHGEAYDDTEYQDSVESLVLYNILENE
ncbi:MAG: alpha-glucan family phosphorylase, partial [Lentisphaerae bacterium]|nr:alpha-glucan family phosphorylase [Lentisphaerota bacterium]